MSALTYEIKDAASPVTQWLCATFPHHKGVQTDFRVGAAPAQAPPTKQVNPSTQGAAIDWWLRMLVDPTVSLDLALIGLRTGRAPCLRAGVELFIGNQLGGKLADANLRRALIGTVAALAAMLFAMTWLVQNQITAPVGILLYGIAALSVVAPLRLRLVNAAGDAPDVASAANISAFTLGSALGIWLGGAAIDPGLGVTSVNWVGGAIATAGVLAALLSLRLDRRPAATPTMHTAAATHHHH